ncbi:MAG TPA: GGDEF domain-containing protein [Acidobacteriaceae bacterium]|nr:GGDEF domain-containing protein [Acidobacteriaceae bacterium]
MLMQATLLIQDVQLVCFTVVFGVLALQRWNDPTRRWLWYSFLANTLGAAIDLSQAHLPRWIGHGLNELPIALSYALLNVAIVYFDKRKKTAVWLSAAILLMGLPLFLAWSGHPEQWASDALADGLIALECTITTALLLQGKEQSTQAPRLVMGGFLIFFVGVEALRCWVAFPLHTDPDTFGHLELVSLVTYIVDTSLLPLAFVWMINARLESDLLQQSIVDALTTVLNRRGLEQALERELARFRRYGEDLTVALLDLDHFKQFNDEYGHAAGDAILVGVARLLSQRLRETDVVGRFGGEEFVLLLPHTERGEAVPILEHLCLSVREHAELLPHAKVRATASFGVTSTQGRRTVSAEELLREADVAMYEAKQAGRNQVKFFSAGDMPAGVPRLFSGVSTAG